MKVNRIDVPYPAVYIDDFFPNASLLRSAAESYDDVHDWVKYGDKSGQVQWCNKLGREYIPTPALIVMDYVVTHFDPNKVFGLPDIAFPDLSYYGGGMMVTPNKNGEGGFLGMHVDATHHGIHKDWKREYSVIIGLSEEYDPSFDLHIYSSGSHARIPYKFNRLWAFKTSEDSWHGINKITEGLDRKTLGIMYWSKSSEGTLIKAKFNDKLRFN
jgi:hypothetical protein|tara:strand:+ start:99 stop:740 length:642 start_codon:yes stop_codon:yes gene_type:complete